MNVLVALAWPSHVHHRLAQEWFARVQGAGFRTCPITQAGFVRVTSNRSFSAEAVTVGAALALLDEITDLAGHEFWPDDLSLREALGAAAVVGHQQITDAYLVGLAEKNGGVVATLDRGVLGVALGREELVEIVG